MATQCFLGIDPGLDGALAVLDVAEDGTQTVTVHPAPVMVVQGGPGRRRVYDVPKLLRLLEEVSAATMAYIEQQGARPGQGVTSTFSIGMGYGLWYGLLTAVAIPFVVVPPQTWRRKLGLPRGLKPPKAVKRTVALAAARRFPTLELRLDHADAVMLAVCAALEHGVDNG